MAIDVLADMLGQSLLRTSDIEAERLVVLEEIAMSEDDPLDLARTELESAAVRRTPAGERRWREPRTASPMSDAAIRRSLPALLHPDNYVITAVGSASHRRVMSPVRRAFGLRPQNPCAHPSRRSPRAVLDQAGSHVSRAFEQVNLLRGHPGIAER
ncbi:MAG: insulinase family protein [Micrococcales bacterium]|nr:insulinase family protein [Micrococcales bacterium]